MGFSTGRDVAQLTRPGALSPEGASPSWWTTGFPNGLLLPYVAGIPRNSFPSGSVPVVQPAPPLDETVTLPYMFPPETWSSPSQNSLGLSIPSEDFPVDSVPEPNMLPVIVLALAVIAMAKIALRRTA